MKKINSTKEKILLILVIYTFGIILGLLFCLLRILGRIKIVHKERFPKEEQKVLVISNHPSLLEPVLLPLLFFRQYIFHPFRSTPWNVPDKANYFDKWYWSWAKVRLIPVDRTDMKKAVEALRKIEQVLKAGHSAIIFPEGGRTSSGEEHFTSKKGAELRKLKGGVGRLISKTDPLIQLVWVNGAENVLPNKPGRLYHCFPRFWRVVEIKLGKPFYCTGIDRDAIMQEITWKLLELADEE